MIHKRKLKSIPHGIGMTSQGTRDRLVQRLRSLGRTVEYFVYDDEGHGFNRFENERLAWQRLVDFLQRHSRSNQGKGVKGPNASRCHHCPVF